MNKYLQKMEIQLYDENRINFRKAVNLETGLQRLYYYNRQRMNYPAESGRKEDPVIYRIIGSYITKWQIILRVFQ